MLWAVGGVAGLQGYVDGRRLPGLALALVVVAALLAGSPVAAAELRVRVQSAGAGVHDAVVSLHPLDGQAVPARPSRAVMDQRNSQFFPRVLAVQAGTRVSFPNSDQIQHQVYSFSQAKPFELPLYAGTAASPVQFERPGVVVVGCNIHDAMIGYIVVVDTPWFGRSDSARDGMVRLQAPSGRYRLQVWHARQPGPVHQQVITVAPSSSEVLVDLRLPAAPPPVPRSDRLRALQEKFRQIEARP